MADRLSAALLGNCTADYIAKALARACAGRNIEAEVYVCPYMQYNQEIYDRESGFYRSQPELTILFLEGNVLFPEWFALETLMEGREEKFRMIRSALDSVVSLAEEIHARCASLIVLNNFRLPSSSPLGILDGKYYPGLRDMVSLLNARLTAWASDKDYVYVFDYRAFASRRGEANLDDAKMRYLTKTTVSLRYTDALAAEYMRYILPLKSRAKKCLVLDLDNTLWGGTAGEDGLAGVKLDIADTGRSFYDFQAEILNLYDKGVILAVNSKNNAEDAMNIIENHPHMVLRKEHFSAMRINWQDKARNMAELAEELNIGTDAMVFFDDSVHERELVRSLLPGVTVVDVPADPARYPDTIRNLIEFEQLRLTDEDIGRNAMYAANKKREEAQSRFGSVEEFLESLGTTVTLEFSNDFNIPRIAQLTLKTNQFNLTTKRYTLEDILDLHRSADAAVLTAQVSDIYGDSGLTGVCVARREGGLATIDTFLLSCRVMGRNIEYAFLGKVVELLRQGGVKTIRARYIKSEKNKAAADFCQNAGFSAVSSDEGGTEYRLDESAQPFLPGHIVTVVKGGASLWTKNS